MKVKAVKPYTHSGHLNFKTAAYEAWRKLGGETAASRYPWRLLHGFAYRWELPTLWKSEREARLRFVEPISMRFDAFPDYATHEIIPFVWDCWSRYVDDTVAFMERHKVRTAFFTSSQTAEIMRRRLPNVNIIHCPEGVDSSVYKPGKKLKARGIDVLEFGRRNQEVLNLQFSEGVNHSYRRGEAFQFPTNEDLYNGIADAKITITLPRSITQPAMAEGIETLTQRYWECMLSRTVMLGHAPQELTDLIGYNPCVELDFSSPSQQVQSMLGNIQNFQMLVDKNRETALQIADWKVRMREVMGKLKDLGYII